MIELTQLSEKLKDYYQHNVAIYATLLQQNQQGIQKQKIKLYLFLSTRHHQLFKIKRNEEQLITAGDQILKELRSAHVDARNNFQLISENAPHQRRWGGISEPLKLILNVH